MTLPRNKIFAFLLASIALFYANLALAYETTLIEINQGSNYKIGTGGNFRRILKMAHSSDWKYGENYFFADVVNFDRSDPVLYAEYDPAISLSKVFKRQVGGWIVLDTLVSGQMYYDEVGSREYSLGLSTYLKPPHWRFKYLVTRVHWRKDYGQKFSTNPLLIQFRGSTYSIQAATQVTFGYVAVSNFLVDWVPKSQDEFKHKHWLFKADLLFDIGRFFNENYYRVYFGPGYSYWNHKLGVRDTNEKVFKIIFRVYI